MKLAAVLLVAATLAYDAFVMCVVVFIIGYFGLKDFFRLREAGNLFIWLFAASPIPVTTYCVNRVRAVMRGEHPRI